MLELQKTLAHSQANAQKEVLDTMLEGAQKAAQVITNIKSISGGNEPKTLPQLYKPETSNNEDDNMIQPPIEPKFYNEQKTEPVIKAAALKSVYDRITAVRGKLDEIYMQGIAGRADLEPLMKEAFDLHKTIFNLINS